MKERIILCGGSMFPALRDGDVLEVARVEPSRLRVGDVIACRPPGLERTVVHRVCSITPGALRTRGDNKDFVDPWTVGPEHLLGRVVSVARGTRRRALAGGARGRAAALGRRLTRLAARPFVAPLRRLYLLLADRAPLGALLPSRLRPRLVTYRSPGGEQARILVGRRAVGEYDPLAGRWKVRRPWRLFVAADLLPAGGGRRR